MDTRYWGPSGWQLLHLIAFKSPNPEQLLLMVKDILPCKFCRESTARFTHDLPMKEPGRWLYDLHNMVNDKLRTQCATDSEVVNPGADPSFEEIKKKYLSLKPSKVPGRDFLFSIAVNYPDQPTHDQMAVQRVFLQLLSKTYPFDSLREVFRKYLSENEASLENQKAYMRWMYGLLSALSKNLRVSMPSYKGYVQRVMYYKSGCSKKTYRGVTCRRISGSYTKSRSNKKTQKIVFKELIATSK
jgi:hypothetical protein